MKRPKLDFDPEFHTYTMGESVVPGISKILRAAGFLQYMKGTKEDLLRGVRVHKATELDDLGSLDEVHFKEHWPELAGYLEAWRKFRAEWKPWKELIGVEVLVGNIRDRYCTHIDRLVRLTNGAVGVLNIKTGDRYPHYILQSIGEEAAVISWHGPQILELWEIYLTPGGEYDPVLVSPTSEDYITWRAALDITNFQIKRGMLSLGKPAKEEEKEEEFYYRRSSLFGVPKETVKQSDSLF